ncbi:aspartate/glutamate racemase [Pandoraea iniqua]|uniref:aspartate/glutamate racemase family protein n=1 Tax=Pandoraea iniqua TaxID=2508288 RepID=UPI001242A98C|nr:aspartate/glutamate racemase family protein [Pandoraea iniqua]VVD88397.1 aspartate/glutamate racemase [Pandoraea iniqua]
MRTIGLIGGMSWQSSAEYYRIINEAVQTRLGPLRSAEMLMFSVDFGPIERAQHEGRWDDAGVLLQQAAQRLEAGGAECVVLCTNTMHKLASFIEEAVSIPLLHVADPVGDAAKARGITCVGLLGTAFTMEQDFIKSRLRDKFGLDVLVPDAADREVVHRVIYDELCVGIVKDASRAAYQEVMARLASRGAQAIVLGCTEISLLVKPEDNALLLLDTTALHANAAVEFALATR